MQWKSVAHDLDLRLLCLTIEFSWFSYSEPLFYVEKFFSSEEDTCCIAVMNKETTILGYENITHFLRLCERDRRTEREEYILLYWPITSWSYHAVFSSRPHLALLLLLCRSLLNWGIAVGISVRRYHQRGAQLLPDAVRYSVYLLGSSWALLKPDTHTLRISRGHLHISFHNTNTFPFNPVTAPGYFHKCVFCSQSLIDGSIKGQYATYRHRITMFVDRANI